MWNHQSSLWNWNVSNLVLLLLKTSCYLAPSLKSVKPCMVHHKHITATKVFFQQLQAHLLLDRVANMEAICVAFIAEYSLSFSISKSLIKVVRVVQRWNFWKDCTCAGRQFYRNRHGFGLTWLNELTNNLRETPFSLNIDESTSTNTKHVYTIFHLFTTWK